MLQDDCLAIARLRASEDNLAVTGCLDGRAARGGIVDTAMRPNGVQDWMATVRIETGADACEIHRCADERLAYAVTFGREIIGLAVGILEPNRLDRAAIVIELGRDDLTVCYVFAVLPDFFELYVIVVALAYIEDEVDVPGEDPGNVHNHLVGQIRFGCAFEQRGTDDAVGVSFAKLNWPVNDAGRKSRFLLVNK